MSREIKFRAWVELDEGDSMIYFDKLECDNGLWFPYFDGHINKHHHTMEFTGLKDKKGNDIYEGDIMYVAGVGECEVIYKYGAFGLKDKNDGVWYFNEDQEQDIEYIIGNIHE